MDIRVSDTVCCWHEGYIGEQKGQRFLPMSSYSNVGRQITSRKHKEHVNDILC